MPTLTCNSLEARKAALVAWFGSEPIAHFSYAEFSRPDDEVQIDVWAFSVAGHLFQLDEGAIEADRIALVTCGLAEYVSPQTELVQYAAKARKCDAHRLHGAAYKAAVAQTAPIVGNTYELPSPAGTAWPSAVLLPPPIAAHAQRDGIRLLWHVPLAKEEFGYQHTHGLPELLHGWSKAAQPWVFEELTRPLPRV
jgi:hypothetical protein